MVKTWLYVSGPTSVLPGHRKLRADDQPEDAAEHEEQERGPEVEQPDARVVHVGDRSPASRRLPHRLQAAQFVGGARERIGTAHRRLARYAVRASRVSPSRWRYDGIRLPGLRTMTVGDPRAQRGRIVGERARRQGAAARHVGEVGAKAAERPRAADGVAAAAALHVERVESPRALGRGRRPRRRGLGEEPRGERLGRVHDDDERHLRVLGAAVLGALPPVHPGSVRAKGQSIDAARDHVDLAAEARDPEAVDDVGRGQDEVGGGPQGEVDLVRRDHRAARGHRGSEPPTTTVAPRPRSASPRAGRPRPAHPSSACCRTEAPTARRPETRRPRPRPRVRCLRDPARAPPHRRAGRSRPGGSGPRRS